MNNPIVLSPAESRSTSSPALAILSLLAPIGGVLAAVLFASVADGLAVIGGIVIAMVGSGVCGAALAVGSLIRKERWRLLGVLGLLVNTVPSIGLFIAILIQRSQM
ncbi:hypothetical protein [Phyllobacterium sp. SB3]|uniref:hypothetical protein n=1 Tax=Phyllobacterium sp. SB3 TaxID=3156073 RepID=UPI0032AF271D